MPALVVGAVTVKVAAEGGFERDVEETGERGRMQDATMREIVRARKSSYRVRTIPLTLSDRDALIAALNSTTRPVACSGDLLTASTTCFPQFLGEKPEAFAGGTTRYVVSFMLHEQ